MILIYALLTPLTSNNCPIFSTFYKFNNSFGIGVDGLKMVLLDAEFMANSEKTYLKAGNPSVLEIHAFCCSYACHAPHWILGISNTKSKIFNLQ